MKYDVIVIGSGPGGYVAAIRASQLGMNTAIIEKYQTLGGTCLNVGCIPSKALLDSSEHYHNARKNFDQHGIQTGKLVADLKKMIDRKNTVVDQNVSGIKYLLDKNKIAVFHGHGSFHSKNEIRVTDAEGKIVNITGERIIIATGSKPVVPPSFNFDKKRVITSTEALNIEKIPGKLIVVGAGVIGLELGSVFARLGTKVEIIEFMDRILPGMDKDAGRELQRSLKRLGIKFYLQHQVNKVIPSSSNVVVEFENQKNNESITSEADYCLVAIGRKPYTDGLKLDTVGIATDAKGRIEVDEHLETNVPGIFAIGDVIKGPMLAHKAEEEGVFVAEYMAGQKPKIHYHLIPSVVYTWPEMAGVGYTEEDLGAKNVPYKVGKFPFKALGRARASMDTEGLVKVIANQETDEILGLHIVGARAADLIMEGVTLMEFRASAEDASRMSHPHPTYSEAIKEAALAATDNRPIHL